MIRVGRGAISLSRNYCAAVFRALATSTLRTKSVVREITYLSFTRYRIQVAGDSDDRMLATTD